MCSESRRDFVAKRLNNIRVLDGFKEHLREETSRWAGSFKRSEPEFIRENPNLVLLVGLVHCLSILLKLPAAPLHIQQGTQHSVLIWCAARRTPCVDGPPNFVANEQGQPPGKCANSEPLWREVPKYFSKRSGNTEVHEDKVCHVDTIRLNRLDKLGVFGKVWPDIRCGDNVDEMPDRQEAGKGLASCRVC